MANEFLTESQAAHKALPLKWKEKTDGGTGEIYYALEVSTPEAGGGGGAGGGSSLADKASFEEGTTAMTVAGGVRNDTPGTDPAEDTGAAVRITPKRAFHVNLRDNGGTEFGTAANPVHITQDALVSEVNLDAANDEVTISGSSDGGTTRHTVRTDSSGRQVVVGGAAEAAAPAGDPVPAAGKDTAGSIRIIRTATDGSQLVVNSVGRITDENLAVLTPKVKSALSTLSGNNTFIAAVAGKRIRVLGYRVQARGTVVVKFFDTDTVPAQITDSPEYSLQDREGVVATAYPGTFEFQSAVGMGVQINLSAAISTMVSVQYVEV